MQEFLTWIFVQTVYNLHFAVDNLFSVLIYYIMIYTYCFYYARDSLKYIIYYYYNHAYTL